MKKTTDKGLGIISTNCVKRKAFVGLEAAHFVHSVSKPRAAREGGSRATCRGAGGRRAGGETGAVETSVWGELTDVPTAPVSRNRRQLRCHGQWENTGLELESGSNPVFVTN